MRWRAAGGFAPGNASADETETHGISSFGDLKYAADFKQLEYVNVNAPKGGVFSQIGPSRQYNQNFLTFNSLNSYILKGDAAQGMGLTFTTLMGAAADEPDGMYGVAARAVRISADTLTYRYLLRPEARFHDGTKLTAHDVAFSLKLLKEKGLDDVLVVIGGIIPDVDIPKLHEMGVKGIFLPGTPMQEIIDFIGANARARV